MAEKDIEMEWLPLVRTMESNALIKIVGTIDRNQANREVPQEIARAPATRERLFFVEGVF
jgi:hypothetical protein